MAKRKSLPSEPTKEAFSPDYTAGDILGLYRVRSAEGDEQRIRDLATQFRALCKLEHVVTIPKQYEAITKQVRTPFVRDAHHRITSSLVAKQPISHVTPKDEQRRDYRDAANVAERWDMAHVERQNKEQGKDIIYDLTAALVRDGESVLKVVHRPDAWANFPQGASKAEQDNWKKGVDLPIAWRQVDRMSVVYEGGEYGDQWVLEYGEYARPYLKNRYGMTESDGRLVDPETMLEGSPMPEGLNQSSTGRSVKVEFFTPEEWHVLIDGTEAPGFPKANPYAPHLPYFRAPAYDHESLLYSLLFLAPRMDEILTMKYNWAVLSAYPTPMLEPVPNNSSFPGLGGPIGDAGDAQGVPNGHPLTWSPGKLFQPPAGYKLGYLIPPPTGKDLNDLALLMKSLIDIAGIPSIMRGVAGAGESGYLGRQLRDAADMAYKLAAMSCQRQLEKALEFTHWLIPNVVKQTVFVLGWQEINPKTGKPKNKAANAWLGLSPDSESKNIANVSKLGPVTVKYRPTPPTDEQANAMIALQLTNAQRPLYSVPDALERFLQEEDTDTIVDNIWVQKEIDENPTLKQATVDAALERAGMRQQPNPAQALVGANGQPLLPQGPIPPGMQGVPFANQAPPGQPGIPGLTMPLQPGAPQPGGIPGNPGGRPQGAYPGQPGGPNLQ